MAKSRLNLATVLIILVVAFLVLQSHPVTWRQPTSVNLKFITEPSEGVSTVHVADTWQEWTLKFTDGSTETRSSAITGLNVRFAVVNLQTVRSLKIEVPIVLASPLPADVLVMVQPSLGVSINNGNPISFNPNWWGPFTFMAGRDAPGSTVTYDFYLLLSGEMQSPAARTIDLRSQIAELNSGEFTLAVTVPEVWDAMKQYAGYGLLPTDHQVIPVAYSVDLTVNLPLFTGTFTVPLPTQTVSTCQGGVCVQVPATTFTTTAPEVTAIVSGIGTTFTLTTTWRSPNQLDFCSWVPWFCESAWGIPNWLIVALAILVLWLLARRSGNTITFYSGE